MIASFSSGLRWTLAQKVTQKHELGLSNPIDMMYFIQPSMILFLLPLAVYIEGIEVISSNRFFRSDDLSNIAYNISFILIGSLLAFFLEASEFLLITYTSSMTLSIAGIFKVNFYFR
jgi:solute carrier family 35, member C2